MNFRTIGIAVALGLLALVAFIILRTRASRTYDATFFAYMDQQAKRSADVMVPELIRIIRPKSVVDVGSGQGLWTKAFMEYGVQDAIAVDGPWVQPGQLKIPATKFVTRDLRQRLRLDRDFDMVLCLETAEHLPPERADSFVEDLTHLAPVIAFSAAIPGQGGTLHLNEQWPDYWAERFRKAGFVALDALRPLMWNNINIAPYYRQNAILYVSRNKLESRPDLRDLPVLSQTVLPLVHPDIMRQSTANAVYEASLRAKFKRLLRLGN